MKNLNNKISEIMEKNLTVEDLVMDPIKVQAREVLRKTVKLPRTDQCNCIRAKSNGLFFNKNCKK